MEQNSTTIFPHTVKIQYPLKNLSFEIFHHSFHTDHYVVVCSDMMSVYRRGFSWFEALQNAIMMAEGILCGKLSSLISDDFCKHSGKRMPLVCEPLFNNESPEYPSPEKIIVTYPDFSCDIFIGKEFETKQFFADCKKEGLLLGYETYWFNAFVQIIGQIEDKHRVSQKSQTW